MTANRKKYNSHIFRWLMVNCCYFSFMNINICTSYQGHGWCSKGKKCPKSHAIDLILDLDGIKTAKNRQRRRKLAALKEQSGDRTSNGMDCKKFVDEEVATLHNSEEILKSDSYTKLVNCSLSMSDDVMEDGNSDEVKISNRSQYNDNIDSIMNAYLETSFKLDESRSGCHRAGFDAFMTGFVMACLLNKHTSVQEAQDFSFGAGLKLNDLDGVEKLRNKVYATGKDQPLLVSKSAFTSASKNHKERLLQVRGSC